MQSNGDYTVQAGAPINCTWQVDPFLEDYTFVKSKTFCMHSNTEIPDAQNSVLISVHSTNPTSTHVYM